MIPAPLIALAVVTFLATLLVAWVVARDRLRYLARFSPVRNPGVSAEYLAGLSNFLETLQDRHAKSAWPTRHDALSATLFQLRARPFWRRRKSPSTHFIEEHLTLWAHLEILRPYIHQAVLAERQRLAVAAILELPETPDRDRLMHFVNHIRTFRDNFAQRLSPADCRLYHQLDRAHFLPALRKIHAVFDEHGYALLGALDDLQMWESLPPAELPRYLNDAATPLPPSPAPGGLMPLGGRTARG